MAEGLTGLAMIAWLQQSRIPLRSGLIAVRSCMTFNANAIRFEELEPGDVRSAWWDATSNRVIYMAITGADTASKGWHPVGESIS